MQIHYKLIGVADSSNEHVEAVAQQQDNLETIEMPDESTISDLTKELKVSASHVLVNGSDADSGTVLEDNDEVNIFGPSAGAM